MAGSPRTFKQIFAADQVAKVFSMARIVHPVMIDLFGLAGGYDGYWLDQEHGGLTYDQIVLGSVCARANGMDTFVRMAPTNYAQVTQNLEAGTGGVLAARIESAAEAEQFVQWAKFAPRGVRGMNTGGRDAHFTHKSQAQFAQDANRDQLVGIQIETAGALGDVEAIAAIDGVDMLFLGPSDLSQSLGYLGQLSHPEIWKAVDRIGRACRQHGKHWGTVPVDSDYADRCVDQGCRLLIIGGDVLSTRRGIETIQRAYAKYFTPE